MYSVDRLSSGYGVQLSHDFKNSHEKAQFDLVANLLDLNNVDICEQVKHRVATVPSPYTVSWATGDGSSESWGEEEEKRKRGGGRPFISPTRCSFLKWTTALCSFLFYVSGSLVAGA